MQLEAGQIYHVYNQGNNRVEIFSERENYLFFLRLVRKFILPFADILAYSLMPNHFHFMIYATEKSVIDKKIGGISMPSLINGFRLLQSSYTIPYNKSVNRTGSLFRQKAKFKNVSINNYEFVCLNYIHQNPYRAGLCSKLENWEFSSFKDYIGERNGTLCQIKMALNILDLRIDNFYEESYGVIPDDKISVLIEDL